MFCSAQLEVASNPLMLKIEHGRLVWFGSAASQARKPVPEFTTIIPPLPTLGI